MGGKVGTLNYVAFSIMYLHMSLSKPDDARYDPSGENLLVNTSPSCPESNMIGASRLENRCEP